MARKKNTPKEREFKVARVAGSKLISPHVLRVTLAGLEGFDFLGSDHWCRLFFARPGQDSLELPTRTSEVGWYLQYLATPKARRPWVRAYTVRAARAEAGEVDIDFVIHTDSDGQTGPAAKWALEAEVGSSVGFLDQGQAYTPDHPHDWTLLIGDETALAAIAGICQQLPDSATGLAFIEIPTAADRQEIVAPPGLEVRWIHRDETTGADAVPGHAALAALREASLPDGAVHAHAIGESGLATGARRHLVNDLGVPKRNVDFVGYWKHGRAATS